MSEEVQTLIYVVIVSLFSCIGCTLLFYKIKEKFDEIHELKITVNDLKEKNNYLKEDIHRIENEVSELRNR